MPTVPVNDNEPIDQYTATSGQTTFAYTFWVEEEADLNVYVNGTLKTLTTDYTVSAVQNDNGANVVFGTGLTTGDKVTITRDTAIDRATGYSTSGSFSAASINLELARIVAMIQEQDRDIDRCVRLSDFSSYGGSLLLPEPSANELIGWNTDGDALTNLVVTDGSVALPGFGGNASKVVRINSAATAFEASLVDADSLAADAVETAKINDLAVTTGKLANGAVTAAKADVASQGEAEAGTDTTKLMTPERTKQAIEARYFESTGQTITSGGGLTIAHGLGVKPSHAQFYLKCTTADNNWSIGDEVELGFMDHTNGTTSALGFVYTLTSTNIVIRFGNRTSVFRLLDKVSRNQADFTNGSWDLYVRVFR